MQFTVISTLAFAAQALAAVSFTSFPNNVQVGKPVTLTYTADDANSPVRIVLRRGPSNDLEDVATLTSSATGGSYSWTPSSDLSNGSDYALEIIQGSAFNYGSQFSISGGSSSSSASSSSSTPAGYSSITTHVPIPLTTGGPSLNKTYGAGNATVAPTGTMPLGSAASAGATGSPNQANTTFSSATLTAPTSSNSGANSGSAGTTTAAAGPAASTTSGSANGAAHVGSSLALILGAVAAFAFLN